MPAIDEAMLEEIYQRALRIERIVQLREEIHSYVTNRFQVEQREEAREIEALRERKRTELVKSASAIFDWVRDFARTPKGRRVLSVMGELTIFRGRYHNFRPTEQEGFEGLLTFDSNGTLLYHELVQLLPGGSQKKLFSKLFSNPEQMVRKLHPNYILSAADSITMGEVWNEVKRDVRIHV